MNDQEEYLVKIHPDAVIRPGDTVEDIIDGEEVKVTQGKDGKLQVKARGYKSFITLTYEPDEIYRRWRKVEGSPAFRFIKMATQKTREKGAQKRPVLLRRALYLAIEGKMRFDADDFSRISKELYVDCAGKYLYSETVASGNKSAIKSLEAYLGRKPFFWQVDGKPQRLVEGSHFRWEGLPVTVTSFHDKKDDPPYIVACHQERVDNQTKTRAIFKITHADIERWETLQAQVNAVITAGRERFKELGIADAKFACRPMLTVEDSRLRCETCAALAWGEKYKDFTFWYDPPDMVLHCAGCDVPLLTRPSREDVIKCLDILYRHAERDHTRTLLTFNHTLRLADTFERVEKILWVAEQLGLRPRTQDE